MNADDHTSAGSASLREVFLGRQPILDKHQALAGYELLFRTTANGDNPVGDPRAATADVVCKAFAQLGLPNVLGLVRAFINVDASFLSEDVIELLPKDMVVFEVDVAALTDPAAVARCRELKEHGYQFVISGLTAVTETLRPLLDLATYLKVDVNSMPVDQLQSVAAELKTTRRTLVACRVESQNQMELCALLGFQLFQGYYFAKPDIIEGRTLDASTQGLFRLIQLIAEEAEVNEIEAAFRTEPALVVNLLRLTNSVGVGARVRISSVRHAITVIGRRQLQRWLQLLLFSRGAQGFARNPLMQYAALRGRFMELLAEKLFPAYREMRDPAFITGLMSIMPAALGMTMANILTQITVDNEVRIALLERAGALGEVLALTERYDDNDVAGVQEVLSRHPGLHIGFLADVLAKALQWVQQLDTENE
jgi:EAL and modified HD-GYP domain-containing signal transduction protein